MSTEPGIDHPAVDDEALVSLTERGISVSSRVEAVDGVVLSLRPSVGDFVGMRVVEPGNLVDVLWQRPEDQLSVPAEVLEVEQGSVVRWRLRMTARPKVSQRRKAVRARVVVPLAVHLAEDVQVRGATADLSEDGARISLAAPGVPRPEPGARVQLRIELDGGVLDTPGELIRVALRGDRWFVSTRFVDLAERDQDRIRRQVFRTLREERARLAAG
jgi:PilZ domain-containing protein